MKKLFIPFLFLLGIIGLTSVSLKKFEEGMFPLSEIKHADLSKAGLKIAATELYNPNGISITDAIVRVGGCTGSFLSNEGLIVTNHHCAFSFVQAISNVKNDYIKNGFLAGNKEQEVPAQGLVCKITASYRDVSLEVLEGTKNLIGIERLSKIATNIKAITQKENAANKDLQCEISEMFTGKTYVLFRYKLLKDVRLVYVPPVSIGAYGGELDNWVWPRHSGDFAFLRAYVAPDGTAADFNKNNVPYKPVKFLEVNKNGVDENDFVFILGYPGRTYRHQPAGFYAYHEKYFLSYISTLYNWQIGYMEQLGKSNDELRIKYAARIKSLANTAKNFEGKLQGFKRVGLSATKQNEEKELQQFIATQPDLMEKYGQVIPQINTHYNTIMKNAMRNMWFDQVFNMSPWIFASATLAGYQQNYATLKTAAERKSFIETEQAQIKKAMAKPLAMIDKNTEIDFTAKMLFDASQYDATNEIAAVKNLLGNKKTLQEITNLVKLMYQKSKLNNADLIKQMLENDLQKLLTTKDVMIDFSKQLYAEMKVYDKEDMERDGALSKLMAQLIEVKQTWQQRNFIPDANGTLRFTYGFVKGYSPNDGLYAKPFTTLKGVIEKSDTMEFQLLDIIKQLYAKKDIADFAHPALGDLPVNLLYNLDTTGGNSGSPVMNKKGQLIAINFDRAFTATINDYAWNEAYSRSVGVDVRYMLWVLQKVAGANHVVNELTFSQ